MIQTARLFALALILTVVPSAVAQTISVDIPDVEGGPGETVLVPVEISGVEATAGITSFEFRVTVSNGNLSLTSVGLADNGATEPDESLYFHSTTGHLGETTGWTVGSNMNTGIVGGYKGGSTLITQSGTLLELQFTIEGVDGGSIVELDEMRFTTDGWGPLPHEPVTPSSGLNASNPPATQNDFYTVDEGASFSADAAGGVLANDTDPEDDPLSVTLDADVSNGSLTLNPDGSFSYEHDGSETTFDSFTYIVSDGSTTSQGTVELTISPVNDAPVFTDTMSSQTVAKGDLVTGTFAATDAENDLFTYEILDGPAGASIDGSGTFSWQTQEGDAGDYPITVGVDDGSDVTEYQFTVSVRQVETYGAALSVVNQSPVFASSGRGSVQATYIPADNELSISGTFENMSSAFATARLRVGDLGEAGTAVVALTAFLGQGATSGGFQAGSNTFDLSALSYPAGLDQAAFETALLAGNVFVNISTNMHLDGEIRAQLHPSTNGAPGSVGVTLPATATVTGDPSASLFSVDIGSYSDPDSDNGRLMLVATEEAQSDDYLFVKDVTAAASSSATVTVEEGAMLFDTITNGIPGFIDVGGTATAYFRIIATDGSSLTVGNTASVDLTRGFVTDTEMGADVPQQFLLKGNYPNPFNPSTTVQFDLPETADVEVAVMDMLGRTMLTVPSQSMQAGVNKSVQIDAGHLGSGIYLYRVVARGSGEPRVATGTMTLIK